MQLVPDITPSPGWLDAWEGYELAELSRGRSANTIRNKKSAVLIMARRFTADGTADPTAVTRAQVNRYLLRDYADRKPGGRVVLYQVVKSFFDWLAAEYETENPVKGIPRPKGAAEPVPVVKAEDIGKILAACKDKTAALTARNTAITWLLIESGLRRFEVTALDLADVDLKARTVTVRKGKGRQGPGRGVRRRDRPGHLAVYHQVPRPRGRPSRSLRAWWPPHAVGPLANHRAYFPALWRQGPAAYVPPQLGSLQPRRGRRRVESHAAGRLVLRGHAAPVRRRAGPGARHRGGPGRPGRPGHAGPVGAVVTYANDGRWPDETPVLVRFPRDKQEERGSREAWPWLPGTVLEQVGPDEWQVLVEDPGLAEARDGDLWYPCVYRDGSELRPAG